MRINRSFYPNLRDDNADNRRRVIAVDFLINTQTQIDISSVNGLNTPFHRKRESGSEWTNGIVVDESGG
jgi:hypothetical protein